MGLKYSHTLITILTILTNTTQLIMLQTKYIRIINKQIIDYH